MNYQRTYNTPPYQGSRNLGTKINEQEILFRIKDKITDAAIYAAYGNVEPYIELVTHLLTELIPFTNEDQRNWIVKVEEEFIQEKKKYRNHESIFKKLCYLEAQQKYILANLIMKSKGLINETDIIDTVEVIRDDTKNEFINDPDNITAASR